MRATRTIKLDELSVTVKELTVAEYRKWLLEEDTSAMPEFDIITSPLEFEGVGMNELYRFTDLMPEQVEVLTYSDLQKVAAVVKELNSVFFTLYLPATNRLLERAQQVRSAIPSASANSNAPSAP